MTNKPLTADEIRAQHEINGARRANADLIMFALGQLKPGDERSNVEKLAAITLEREQVVTVLRRIAELAGQCELPEGLSLPEIVETHIALPVSELIRENDRMTNEAVTWAAEIAGLRKELDEAKAALAKSPEKSKR